MIDEFPDKIINGDCYKLIKEIPDKSIDLIITPPPYYKQRDYGSGIGNEKKVEEYINNLCDIFHECVRILKDTVNIGDCPQLFILLIFQIRRRRNFTTILLH